MARFTLYINFREKVIEKPLPAENNRVIFLDFSDIADECGIKLEVFDNIWSIYSDENNVMSIDGVNFESHVFADGDIIKVYNQKYNFVILVYEMTQCITDFRKYSIKDKKIIKVGKNDSCDIAVDSKYISTNHAEFIKTGNEWIYRDSSLNGSYINGERVERELRLSMFDVISMVGFKMVFLGDYIAVNREDIVICTLPKFDGSNYTESECDKNQMFLRSPRTIEPLFDDVIEIESPPSPNRQKNQPLIFIIGPSVTMPLPILMSTYINSITRDNSSSTYLGIIASVGMSALIAGGWAIAHYAYNKKTMKEDECFRVSAYKEYIQKNEQLIRDKHNYDSSVLISQFLSSEDIINRIPADTSFVWNRNVNHTDFLSVRIGTGNVDFSSHISVPKQRFSLFKDNMSELPGQVYDKYKYIHNAVVTIPLKEMGILGMLGCDSYINKTVESIIIQIAALHCYTDVRIAAFFNENEYNDFGWIRWLPHVNSEDMKLRMVARERISYQNVLCHIDEILRQRSEKLTENNHEEQFYPHYIVLCTDRDIFDGDGIEKYIPIAEKIGFTFILAYKRLDRLPNECNNIVQCDYDFSGYYILNNKRTDSNRVEMDTVLPDSAEKFAKNISRLRVREYATGEIPNAINYFDMIGIGRLEQWDLIKKYKENRTYEGICSFVGIGVGGKKMYIDINEKKHGPHGLVAGTTGSGKSEALQTFIISLAMNYHPDEVAFILIDYKGGGMALAFDGLPHIAGMITNLGSNGSNDGKIDGNITRRALVSIRREKEYRQAVFNKYGINHIDAYTRMYRENKADVPLPHLIIISDEFAELKKEQPEFIKELVSTSRVGRSLGIHLILATQKPGGVVDDEIWSNSRFRLCLKVQDKQDSMGMLKRPEAAYLTQTGRCYLQVGNDEIFEQFQTGYSGADYNPTDEAGSSSISDLYMMNIDGTVAVTRENKQEKKGDKEKQLKAAVKYISKVCKENNIRAARTLWLPELDRQIFLDDLYKKYSVDKSKITAVFGLIDDPERQQQYPAQINFANCSNLLISGIAGIGKTTMLQTMIISVIKNYSCSEVIFYILDFSSGTLRMFNNVKHCGLVATSDDKDAVVRIFKFLFSELDRRKNLFGTANVGSYTEYIRNNELPLCIFIIDNYFSFIELYPELTDNFSRLSRECAKYGIQIIITCNSLSDIRIKVRQNFVNVLTLEMAEKSDYREAWGISASFLPQNCKGRGLILSDGRLLEYQTALPCMGISESDRHDIIAKIIEDVNLKDIDIPGAEKVKTLPFGQSYEAFYLESDVKKLLPIGYDTEDVSVYGADYDDLFCYAVSGAENKSISLVLNNLAYAAKKSGGYIYYVKLKQEIKLATDIADKICRNKESVIDMLVALREPFHCRAIQKKAYLSENPDGDFALHLCESNDKIYVFIDSMNEFLNMIYDSTNKEDMHTITETYFKNGKGMGIYFIAGFDSGVYGQNYYRSACKIFTEYNQAIHLGGRFDKQKLVDVRMPVSQMSKPEEYFVGRTNYNGSKIIFVPGGQITE